MNTEQVEVERQTEQKVCASVRFEKDTKGASLLAIYTAQLIREGVTFEVADCSAHWEVELLGGF